jgi:hypothetical protein
VTICVIFITFFLGTRKSQACAAAKQDRRYLIAFSKDESRYAVARFVFERDGSGAVEGTSFYCVSNISTNQLSGKCKKVKRYRYNAKDGIQIGFHHDFFLDKFY